MSKNRSSALKREREQRKAEKNALKRRRREARKNSECVEISDIPADVVNVGPQPESPADASPPHSDSLAPEA